MKTLGLVLALILVVGSASFAETGTIDIYSGWNMISAPLVPIDPVVDNMFNQFDTWFTSTIMRWDPAGQAYVVYDCFAPETFGGVLLGDGMWFNDPSGAVQTYDGVEDGVPSVAGDPSTQTDMWISLPGNQVDGVDEGGWHMIGTPFNHTVAVDPNFNYNGEAIQFTDGVEMKIWDDAVQAGWVESQMLAYDNTSGAYQTMGYFFNDVDSFVPGAGYWFRTLKDNLAMIVPAN